ncbi:Integrase-like protein [Vibrio crassostreae]|uniref:Uncharacterized protein n=2 Tax=Vibrio TaxID=662 RepID=A0AA86WU20_9VIBR|nr:conserved hypothetical protein [Vibrio chagasii]CAK1753143.1 Integrase-like protein [Vibrio crassostreae]CDT91020.1 hypothetical protein VCR29J2_80025 [Vibrio coralliirubri]CAH7131666.1 conserved hypothetical protein [Vibrio chagasii]CAH7136945.1 conserved hypothetical protein [Vibrio chagasii]
MIPTLPLSQYQLRAGRLKTFMILVGYPRITNADNQKPLGISP